MATPALTGTTAGITLGRADPDRSGGTLIAEGLNPIEVGKKPHEHGVANISRPGAADSHGNSRTSRVIQIGEALLPAP